MKPIGLTLKRDGELMVVHECLNCGKISSNRIAGDDNTYTLVALLNEPVNKKCRFELLTKDDEDAVFTTLFGYDYRE